MSLFGSGFSNSGSLFTSNTTTTNTNTGGGTTTNQSPDFSNDTLLCSDLKSDEGFLSNLYSNVTALQNKTQKITYDGTHTKMNSKFVLKTAETTATPNTIPVYVDNQTIKKSNVSITGGTDINCSNIISDSIYAGVKSYASHPSNTKQGLIYYNTTEKRLKIYQNNGFVDLNYHHHIDSESQANIKVFDIHCNNILIDNKHGLKNILETTTTNSIVKFDSPYTTKQSGVLIDNDDVVVCPSYLKLFNTYKAVGYVNSSQYGNWHIPILHVVNNYPLLKQSSCKITNDLFEALKMKCTELKINDKPAISHDSTVAVNSIPIYGSSTDTILKCSNFNINPTTDTLNGNRINCSELFVNNVALSTNFTNLETKVDNIDTAFTSLQTTLPTISQVTNIHNVLVSLYNLVQSLSITNISGLTQAILDSNTNNSPYNYFTSTAVDDSSQTTNSTWSSTKIATECVRTTETNVPFVSSIDGLTYFDTLGKIKKSDIKITPNSSGVDGITTGVLHATNYMTIENTDNQPNTPDLWFIDKHKDNSNANGGFIVKDKDNGNRCNFGSFNLIANTIGIHSYNNTDDIVLSTSTTPSLTVKNNGDIYFNKKTGTDGNLKIDTNGKIYLSTASGTGSSIDDGNPSYTSTYSSQKIKELDDVIDAKVGQLSTDVTTNLQAVVTNVDASQATQDARITALEQALAALQSSPPTNAEYDTIALKWTQERPVETDDVTKIYLPAGVPVGSFDYTTHTAYIFTMNTTTNTRQIYNVMFIGYIANGVPRTTIGLMEMSNITNATEIYNNTSPTHPNQVPAPNLREHIMNHFISDYNYQHYGSFQITSVVRIAVHSDHVENWDHSKPFFVSYDIAPFVSPNQSAIWYLYGSETGFSHINASASHGTIPAGYQII